MRTAFQTRNRDACQRASKAKPVVDHSLIRRENPILRLQRTVGNQATMRLLRSQQATPLSNKEQSPVRKLTISNPADKYEQEAERVLQQVMQMPAAVKGRDSAGVQLKATGSESTSGTEAPPIVEEVLCSPGHPLDAQTRAFMEPRFGYDFSGVRVHTDEKAAESAGAVRAKAYTVGNNVVFGPGEFAPGTHQGQRLLGHELTHVVQQGRLPVNVAQVQRQPAGQTQDTKEKAIKDHEDQQRNVSTLLDEARKFSKYPDMPEAADNLYLNTLELLDNQKMGLIVMTPAHYSTAQNPVYFDQTVKYPDVGGNYPDQSGLSDPRVISPQHAGARGETLSQPVQQPTSISTMPPKVEKDPITKEPVTPPSKARAKTPPVIAWTAADVRLYLDRTPISQAELRNIFVHEGQHVADWSYLKSAKLNDWKSMLELYKSEFRAFWFQPPIGRTCRDCPALDTPFPDPDPIKTSTQQKTVTVKAGRQCTACPPPPTGTNDVDLSQLTKMKNERQQSIFWNLITQYPKNEFDCFYVCNKDFRDAVNDFDMPGGENAANSMRLMDFRLELQKLIPDMTGAEVKNTNFVTAVKALDAIDWAFLTNKKLSDPLWQLIHGFAPKPIYEALKAVAAKKNPTKDAPTAIDNAVKKLK